MEKTERSLRVEVSMVALFLGAVVIANLLVSRWGQVALPITAFVLIPFDLVTRDVLHEHWQGRRLWARMALLIASGSILSAILSPAASRVALGSGLGFGVAGLVNALVYHLLRHRSRLVRMNVSNAFAAIADSAVFPLVAFWPAVDAGLCATQAASKFAGGLLWSWLFVKLIWRKR